MKIVSDDGSRYFSTTTRSSLCNFFIGIFFLYLERRNGEGIRSIYFFTRKYKGSDFLGLTVSFPIQF